MAKRENAEIRYIPDGAIIELLAGTVNDRIWGFIPIVRQVYESWQITGRIVNKYTNVIHVILKKVDSEETKVITVPPYRWFNFTLGDDE